MLILELFCGKVPMWLQVKYRNRLIKCQPGKTEFHNTQNRETRKHVNMCTK